MSDQISKLPLTSALTRIFCSSWEQTKKPFVVLYQSFWRQTVANMASFQNYGESFIKHGIKCRDNKFEGRSAAPEYKTIWRGPFKWKIQNGSAEINVCHTMLMSIIIRWVVTYETSNGLLFELISIETTFTALLYIFEAILLFEFPALNRPISGLLVLTT